MMRKVLVPLDGSRTSEEALGPVLELLKQAEHGNIVLLHAVTPAEYFSMPASQVVQRERRRSAAYLQALAERIANGTGVQERVVTGEASREIVAEARRCHADLIAMSSHGRSGIREWAFGSVAERVLRTTHVPVLVIRGNGSKPSAIRKILIALDGSEEALEVVRPAAELAAALGAEVLLVHAGKSFPAAFTKARTILEELKVPFASKLVGGDAAAAILRTLQEEQADVLALTTAGRSKRDHLFFGSVAEEILRKCTRPLLVVHPGNVA